LIDTYNDALTWEIGWNIAELGCDPFLNRIEWDRRKRAGALQGIVPKKALVCYQSGVRSLFERGRMRRKAKTTTPCEVAALPA
tara:strand:- start:215 stop:463 length:249 start_codon:yes stop_codon:yes gene_type:complete